MSFLAPILCVFEQIITFALHFRDVGCIIKLAGPTGGWLFDCLFAFLPFYTRTTTIRQSISLKTPRLSPWADAERMRSTLTSGG